MNNIGINAHFPSYELLEKIREANLQWVRVDMNWTHFEGKEKNLFYWDTFDRITDYCRSYDINLLGILAYVPKWANEGKGIGVLPNDIHNWIDFVFHVTKRYKDFVKHWEIWNEPNLLEYFEGTPREYGEKILATASVAIREVDPNAKIVAPALSTNSWNWIEWMDMIRWASIEDLFDILSIHTYRTPAKYLIGNFTWIYNWLPKVLRKPMWVTETGWSTNYVSEKQQAQYYREFIDYLPRSNIDKVFFYELIDDPTQDWRYGLLRADHSKKETFDVITNFCGD